MEIIERYTSAAMKLDDLRREKARGLNGKIGCKMSKMW